MKISTFKDALISAKEGLDSQTASILKDNPPYHLVKETVATLYLLVKKLEEVIEDLNNIVFHVEHGINKTIPDFWNAFTEDDVDPYSPYEAILQITYRLESLPLFSIDVREFVRQIPSIEKKLAEVLDQMHGPQLLKFKNDGSHYKISHEERTREIHDAYLENLEKTFGLEDWHSEIKAIQIIAVTEGQLEQILTIIKE